jgi:hypothetical protein
MILHQGYMKKKDIPRIGLVKGEIEKQVSSSFFFSFFFASKGNFDNFMCN